MEVVKVVKNEQYLPAAMAILNQAERSVDICTYKFELSNRPAARGLNQLIHALYYLAVISVRVRILLNTTGARSGLRKINEHAARELKKHDIQVRTLPDNRCQHAKTLVVDDCIGIIGSHNWTPKSLTENYEVGVVVYHAGYLLEIQKHFEEIWHKAIRM